MGNVSLKVLCATFSPAKLTTIYKSISEGNVNLSLLSVDYLSFLIMAF